MKLRNSIWLATFVLLTICIIACNKERIFEVNGKLTGNPPERVALERLGDNGEWIAIDSVAPDKDGSFKFKSDAPDFPELYRIAVNGKYVYLPVDSTEVFTLNANVADISRGFKLTGSPQADAMTAFEAEFIKVEGYNNPDSTYNFKRRVYNRWLKDAKGNIFSYYVLTRPMGQGYFIEYTDPVYRAVATAFNTFRPDDPHTPLLAENARIGVGEDRRRKGITTQYEAKEISFVDFKLPDVNGDSIPLSSVVLKGKPTVLVFGGMSLESSAASNSELRKLYEGGRANIYHVCMDQDRFAWKRGASQVPWTVVYDSNGIYGTPAISYNIPNAKTLPIYFIFDSTGELVQSTSNLNTLPSLIP
ncbi:MAG: DUF4369 domain-containing protein [Muribaculaceae bacterium]|nr:DUF4369 domain-containing protein [Muribaculaceae bacterium]